MVEREFTVVGILIPNKSKNIYKLVVKFSSASAMDKKLSP